MSEWGVLIGPLLVLIEQPIKRQPGFIVWLIIRLRYIGLLGYQEVLDCWKYFFTPSCLCGTVYKVAGQRLLVVFKASVGYGQET